MRKELDEALCRDFPRLYRLRDGSMERTAMCWGFTCGDGWYELIRHLSEYLEKEIEKYVDECPEDTNPPCAAQVKEKFGTLRFYMHTETDPMSQLINAAEHASAFICEQCGRAGKLRGGNWLRTLCDECHEGGTK